MESPTKRPAQWQQKPSNGTETRRIKIKSSETQAGEGEELLAKVGLGKGIMGPIGDDAASSRLGQKDNP